MITLLPCTHYVLCSPQTCFGLATGRHRKCLGKVRTNVTMHYSGPLLAGNAQPAAPGQIPQTLPTGVLFFAFFPSFRPSPARVGSPVTGNVLSCK